VSSGLRPGAITSSGNPSFHGTGEALDMAGPAPAMMRFARHMAANFGPRLAELIYSPMGFSIDSGRRVAPYAVSDHYDHVHVAVDLPGVGDGRGRRPRTGDGIGQAVQAARAAGFRGQSLVNAVAIAGAESRYNAEALNPVYPDYSVGMWQINMLAHGSRYGNEAQLKNPFRNAKAAYAISSGGKNFGPWSTWPTAAKGWLARARAAARGGSSGGSLGASGGGGGTTNSLSGVVGGKGGAIWGIPKVGSGGGVPQGTAKGGASGLGALGSGGTLGDMASPVDFIDSAIAQAALTPGLGDDKAAVGSLVDFWSKRLAWAKTQKDPRLVTEAATNLKGAQDQLAQLTEAITGANRLAEERMALDKQLVENQLRLLAVAENQPNSLNNALIDAVNGGIGGYAGLAFETPSFASGLARS
jgi:hypothetical protein